MLRILFIYFLEEIERRDGQVQQTFIWFWNAFKKQFRKFLCFVFLFFFSSVFSGIKKWTMFFCIRSEMQTPPTLPFLTISLISINFFFSFYKKMMWLLFSRFLKGGDLNWVFQWENRESVPLNLLAGTPL